MKFLIYLLFLFFLVVIIQTLMPGFVFLIAPGFSENVEKLNLMYI